MSKREQITQIIEQKEVLDLTDEEIAIVEKN